MNMDKNKKICWDDISIKQYLQIMDIVASEKNEMVKMTQLIQVIYDLDMENIPIVEALEYQNDVRELLSSKPDIKKVQKKYKIGNTEY